MEFPGKLIKEGLNRKYTVSMLLHIPTNIVNPLIRPKNLPLIPFKEYYSMVIYKFSRLLLSPI